jgi:adenylate cyclase
MSNAEEILTILFADISGSTNLYESLGDETAHKIIEECLSMLSVSARLHDGEIVKTMGDGIMCSFHNATNAAEASVAMNQAADRISERQYDRHVSMNIRTGFHAGPVIQEGNDIFGDTVNVAARITSLAKPRQIITTKQTTDLLTGLIRDKASFFDRTSIKGKGGEFDLFEIVWEEGDRTLINKTEQPMQGHQSFMNIVYGEKKICVDSSNPSITIGRHEHNTIEIDDTMVSRSHCKIEYHKGKFIFFDQSSNGSHIHNEGGYTVYVQNDETVLGDSGYICLGHDGPQNSRLSISFKQKIR